MLGQLENLECSMKTYLAFVARSGGRLHHEDDLSYDLEHLATSPQNIHIKVTHLGEAVFDRLAHFRINVRADSDDTTTAGKTTGVSNQLIRVYLWYRCCYLG